MFSRQTFELWHSYCALPFLLNNINRCCIFCLSHLYDLSIGHCPFITSVVQFTIFSVQENSYLCSTYTSMDGPNLTRAQILRKYSTCWLLYNSLNNKQEMVSLFFSAGEQPPTYITLNLNHKHPLKINIGENS